MTVPPPLSLDLGRVGVWSAAFGLMPAAEVRTVVPQLEELGFRTVWSPESFAKEFFANAGTVLAASTHLIFAGGIANIWARDPTAMMNGARTLEEAYPQRLVLGIGVSHEPSATRRGGTYRRPFSIMERYLDAMAEALYVGPQPESDPPLVLAALGPRMLKLAADRTAGAHPYFVPVEHTKRAREILGAGPLLAPEQAVVMADDGFEAREIARTHTSRYLAMDNYRNNLLRLGFSEADTSGSGSDRLVDAVVAWGSVGDIAGRVSEHFEAGADHVSVQILTRSPSTFPIEEWRRLAPALLVL